MKTGYLGTAADGGDGDSLGEAGATPAPEAIAGPPPWKWSEHGHSNTVLLDGDGVVILVARETEDAGAHALELIRLAPEMEEMLRQCEWAGDGRDEALCPDCGGSKPLAGDRPSDFIGHQKDCDMARIIAALDAARKAGG